MNTKITPQHQSKPAYIYIRQSTLAQVRQKFTINGEVGTGETVPWPIGAEIRKNFGGDFN